MGKGVDICKCSYCSFIYFHLRVSVHFICLFSRLLIHRFFLNSLWSEVINPLLNKYMTKIYFCSIFIKNKKYFLDNYIQKFSFILFTTQSPLKHRVDFHSFTQWPLRVFFLQWPQNYQILPGLSCFLKPQRKTLGCPQSHIFHITKASTTWMALPSSTSGLRWTLAPGLILVAAFAYWSNCILESSNPLGFLSLCIGSLAG